MLPLNEGLKLLSQGVDVKQKNTDSLNWFARAVGVWFADVSGITVVLIMALIYSYLMCSFSMLSAMGTVVFNGVSRRRASAS